MISYFGGAHITLHQNDTQVSMLEIYNEDYRDLLGPGTEADHSKHQVCERVLGGSALAAKFHYRL